MNVAVRIQHHESRAALLPDLLAALDGFPDVEVVTDPGGSAADTWRSHRACLEAMPGQASHLLCLQDDAVPCAKFCAKLCAAVQAKPQDVLLFFAPGFGFVRRRMLEARQSGAAFALFPQTAFLPTVAVVYPRGVRDALLAWADGAQWPRPGRPVAGADDGVVAKFMRAQRRHAWATVPSLVEHRVDVPSLVRPGTRDGAHRRAAMLDSGPQGGAAGSSPRS